MKIDLTDTDLIVATNKKLMPIPEGMRYMLGKKGTYIQRNNSLFVSSVPGEVDLPGLLDVPVGVKFKTPKIPLEMMNQAVSFFEVVDEKYKSESALILYWSLLDECFSWGCPEQTISGARVEFSYPTEAPMGCVVFGDFHSHPGMGSSPSWQDESDELYRDGLHLIAGYIGGKGWWKKKEDAEDKMTLSATFSVDGHRITLKPTVIVEGIPDRVQCLADKRFPSEWLDMVKKQTYFYQKGPQGNDEFGTGVYGYEGLGGVNKYGNYQSYYGGGRRKSKPKQRRGKRRLGYKGRKN